MAPKRERAGKLPEHALAAFAEAYIAKRTDLGPARRANLRVNTGRVVEYFGGDRQVADIKASDAQDFGAWLRSEYAQATASKTVLDTRQLFAYAIDAEIIERNPFSKIKAGTQKNDARLFTVTHEMTEALIDAAPDHEWRLIIALARYGGLRTPSETLLLGWADIDWAKSRFRVTSPKKDDTRWVPIFPELRPHFEAAFEATADDAIYCIARNRGSTGAQRYQLNTIIRRAGLKPRRRAFQNLRSSRESELARLYPLRDVCAWIGNSPKIAAEHYLQTSDEEFQRAAKQGAKTAA